MQKGQRTFGNSTKMYYWYMTLTPRSQTLTLDALPSPMPIPPYLDSGSTPSLLFVIDVQDVPESAAAKSNLFRLLFQVYVFSVQGVCVHIFFHQCHWCISSSCKSYFVTTYYVFMLFCHEVITDRCVPASYSVASLLP